MRNKCENCGKCCLETEMILSQQDVDLIINNISNKSYKEYFKFKRSKGYYQLRNIEGHCVFFELATKNCKIYEYRPQGCRFYPLIYDFQKQDCSFDADCPRIHLFYQDKNILTKTCEKLKKFLNFQLKCDID
ncbi:MAG: YkgJ family cysteine cluster protein [Candidatus Hermodarchaeota archaeon]